MGKKVQLGEMHHGQGETQNQAKSRAGHQHFKKYGAAFYIH
jgi:hypothetical protein